MRLLSREGHNVMRSWLAQPVGQPFYRVELVSVEEHVGGSLAVGVTPTTPPVTVFATQGRLRVVLDLHYSEAETFTDGLHLLPE